MTNHATTCQPIKVFIADDSPIAVHMITRILESDDGIKVVGTANNGKQALIAIKRYCPDVVCTDLHMPVMDGLELIRCLMVEQPLPILVVSVSVGKGSEDNVFELLKAGAVDVFSKPRAGFRPDSVESIALRERVRLLAGVRVFRKHLHAVRTTKPSTVALRSRHRPEILAIGASTGGPQSLELLLAGLPVDFPLPILCVQHISTGFLDQLIDWLDQSCKLKVLRAVHGILPRSGGVYFAPEGTHLRLGCQGRLYLDGVAPEGGHRPAVNVLFRSVAKNYGPRAIAVLLTGMGRDGADGMLSVAHDGGVTIAQDKASCVVFGMPKEAITLGAAKQVLPLAEIGPALVELASQGDRRRIRRGR